MRDSCWMVEIRPFAQRHVYLVCFGRDEAEARKFYQTAKRKPCKVEIWDMMSGTPVREK